VLLYLDQTIIQTSIALSRVAISNTLGILIVIPFLIVVVAAGRTHFKTINDTRQTTLLYRAEHAYFFLYDSHYHLNYIDHIFEADSLEEGEGRNHREEREGLRRPFYPESNLMIMELLFKLLLATSTIIFYQYEPYLFAYLCLFLMAIFLYAMDNLFYY
jgi:hypothetical protein